VIYEEAYFPLSLPGPTPGRLTAGANPRPDYVRTLRERATPIFGRSAGLQSRGLAIGRRYAGWDAAAAELASDPRTSESMNERQRLGEIDLAKLAALPEGRLDSVFAAHCVAWGLNPNLADSSAADAGEFVMAYLFDSHDIWHVVTGWDQ